jgi:sterol desaturase/sphingolipid hydroxylase (fatty acid hydroxylase superfamily)
MSAEALLGLLVPATYLFFLFTESRWPARSFPARKGWQWLGAGFLVLMMTIGTVLPLVLPVDWLAAHRLLDGTRLGVVGGTIVGYVVMEGVIYGWHRTMHTFDFTWRGFHQIHHSPNRVDIPGSTLFHPTEMIVGTMLQVGCTVFVLGLEPLAAGIVGYLIAFNTFFQHWNVRTPQWLGYLIQRPESHCEHHRMRVHFYNFSDFPPWDMLFGTFRNPRAFAGPCGFEGGADRRLAAMLAFRDVNAEFYPAGSLGQQAAQRPSNA